ncbi:MAG: hypothetical protein E7Z90_01060 [Cyanobacteria bacterium SIG29]|nr:hypothetical protein [Cyanobacteria bacterium SIG29]
MITKELILNSLIKFAKKSVTFKVYSFVSHLSFVSIILFLIFLYVFIHKPYLLEYVSLSEFSSDEHPIITFVLVIPILLWFVLPFLTFPLLVADSYICIYLKAKNPKFIYEQEKLTVGVVINLIMICLYLFSRIGIHIPVLQEYFVHVINKLL